MSREKYKGVCALTGAVGPYVRCHILPQAFTRPSVVGEALYQSTRGRGEARRWSSWYDPKLVIRKGEDILSKIDDAAIKELRKHMLVWGGWTIFQPHFEKFGPAFPEHGYRVLSGVNTSSLIRFGLSVAWRASVSTMADMAGVSLNSSQQTELKKYVLGAPITETSSFPISLIQLSTKGMINNQAPFTDTRQHTH